MSILTPRIDTIENKYSPSGVLGNTDGAAVSSGYVGQELISSTNSTTDVKNITANIMSMSLPAGVWDVTGSAIIDLQTFGGTAFGSLTLSVDAVSLGLNDPNLTQFPFTYNTNYGWRTPETRVVRFNLTTTTTIYLVGNFALVSGTISTIQARANGCILRAVRVA